MKAARRESSHPANIFSDMSCSDVKGSDPFNQALFMRYLLILITLTMAAAASAEQQTCSRNEFGVFEDISCAVVARDKADKELNATYQKLLSILTTDDKEALRKAQRAWLSFVKADANFVLVREGDGSLGRLIVVNNREKLTRERVEALKAWIPH